MRDETESLPVASLPRFEIRVDHVQVHTDVVGDRNAELIEPSDDGVGLVQVQILDGRRVAPRQRQGQRAGDLEHVGVRPGVVEHEDLLEVIGPLDDGEQVVLALGQQRGGYDDVMDRVVDLVDTDADPRGGQRDEREQRAADRDQHATEPPPLALSVAAAARNVSVERRSRGPKPCGDSDRQLPPRRAARPPARRSP